VLLTAEAGAGVLTGWPVPPPHAAVNEPSAATPIAPPMKRRRDKRWVVVSVTILGPSMGGNLPDWTAIHGISRARQELPRRRYLDRGGPAGRPRPAWSPNRAVARLTGKPETTSSFFRVREFSGQARPMARLISGPRAPCGVFCCSAT
jgi:hypothetical protein